MCKDELNKNLLSNSFHIIVIVNLPGSTVIGQYIRLSQEIAISLMVTPIRSELKQLHKKEKTVF